MNPKPGEVWLADLGLSAKTRPVIIVSRSDQQRPRALTTFVPITSQYRNSRYEVVLPRLRFLPLQSIANVQGVGSLADARLERKLGSVSEASLAELRAALAFLLGLRV